MGISPSSRTVSARLRMNDPHIAPKIEALLFALGRPLSFAELAKMLASSEENIRSAAAAWSNEGRGVVLVEDGRTVELRASGEASKEIENARREEFSREIGKAGLEVLAAVLYRGPLSRSEIDFIRGVNSSQTVRTLTMRGLIRKLPNPRDERSFLYEPTTELLAELGVMNKSELPEHAKVRASLEELEAAYRAKEE